MGVFGDCDSEQSALHANCVGDLWQFLFAIPAFDDTNLVGHRLGGSTFSESQHLDLC